MGRTARKTTLSLMVFASLVNIKEFAPEETEIPDEKQFFPFREGSWYTGNKQEVTKVISH